MGELTLVLGGQKAGKSTVAARLAEAARAPVAVVAPAAVEDEEMAERVRRHRADRPPRWRTLETFDLSAGLRDAGPETCVVVDALDTWLAHAMGEAGLLTDADVAPLGEDGNAAFRSVLDELAAFASATAERPGPTIVVAGQPGLGLHAIGAASRRYADLHGLALQRLGQTARRMLLVTAGRVTELEPPPAASAVAPVPGTSPDLRALLDGIAAVDARAAARARRRQHALAKPPGSLGQLEAVGEQLAAITGVCPPPVPSHPALLLAAGDHGVHEEGVSVWPQEVTRSVAAAACAGNATSAVLADSLGARRVVLDVGVRGELADHPLLLRRRVRDGSRNLAQEDALTAEEVEDALRSGAATADALIADGADLLVLGEMGIANTTPSACVIAACTGADAQAVTGAGAGSDAPTVARKTAVVQRGLARLGSGRSPLAVLAGVGGLEHAALVGAVLAGAGRRVPVLLDGVTTNAAALVAVALAPSAGGYLLAGHRSAEPGADVALGHLDLEPLLDLGQRLGEGSGALLAVPLVQAAARVLNEVALLSDLTE